MIPKKSTPIKNEILIDIFAKGKLSQIEMRIIFYIIRWSWGFDGVKRRQDWTKELTKRKIADDINIDRGKCCYILNKMIKENKVTINKKCYQFNEHYEGWIKLTKSQSLQVIKVDEKSINDRQNINLKLIKSQSKVDEKSILTPIKPLRNKPLPDCKETLKENFKETLKEKGADFIKAWKDFKEMRKKKNKSMTLRAEELIINELNKLTNNEVEQVAILNQSIMNSWQGVFPLKGATKDEEYNYPKYKSKKISKEEAEENRKRGQKEILKALKKLKEV